MATLQATNQQGVRSATNTAATPKTLYTATGKATVNNFSYVGLVAGPVVLKILVNGILFADQSVVQGQEGSVDGVIMLESGETLAYECDTDNGVAVHASILEVEVQ